MPCREECEPYCALSKPMSSVDGFGHVGSAIVSSIVPECAAERPPITDFLASFQQEEITRWICDISHCRVCGCECELAFCEFAFKGTTQRTPHPRHTQRGQGPRPKHRLGWRHVHIGTVHHKRPSDAPPDASFEARLWRWLAGTSCSRVEPISAGDCEERVGLQLVPPPDDVFIDDDGVRVVANDVREVHIDGNAGRCRLVSIGHAVAI